MLYSSTRSLIRKGKVKVQWSFHYVATKISHSYTCRHFLIILLPDCSNNKDSCSVKTLIKQIVICNVSFTINAVALIAVAHKSLIIITV